MKEQIPDPAILFKTKSSRHHYIPQFLLEGFTNDEGLMFIYDKKQRRVLNKPRPPKSVFFEHNRNTVKLDDQATTSIIEDYLYSQIDSQGSKIVRKYQQQALKEIDFTAEDAAHFLFFLINLFWRLPYTDFASEDIMNRSTITSPGINIEELRTDPAFRKMMRVGLFKHHIEQMTEFGPRAKQWVNIHQYQSDVFVIGDNPIMFKNLPKEFKMFDKEDLMIAINSKRIYVSTNQPFDLKNFNPAVLNTGILQQSVRYIACSNLQILEQTIQLHEAIVKMGLQYSISSHVFS